MIALRANTAALEANTAALRVNMGPNRANFRLLTSAATMKDSHFEPPAWSLVASSDAGFWRRLKE
jgi:hypothetical protein